mmetsp:Transcript_34234/g.79091  ORF Transcript_34234/g.79091 Transcript_34234/m.79091 type:complete len:147 (+) Transcript_34234:432-872(+)
MTFVQHCPGFHGTFTKTCAHRLTPDIALGDLGSDFSNVEAIPTKLPLRCPSGQVLHTDGTSRKSKSELPATTSSRSRSSPFFVIRTSKSKSELPTISSRARSPSFFAIRTSTTVAGIITLGIVSNGIITTTTYNSTTPDHHEYKRE